MTAREECTTDDWTIAVARRDLALAYVRRGVVLNYQLDYLTGRILVRLKRDREWRALKRRAI